MSGAQVVVLLVLALVGFVIIVRARSLRHPTPFPPWLTPLLESPLRRLLMNPERTLARSGLAPGMRVLEVGPGSGLLSEGAVRRLGPEGRLCCLDLQIEMLRKVRRRLDGRGAALVCASGSALPFRPGVFDLVFLVTVLGEIPDKAGALREYARVLKPRGTLAVTEAFPDPDYVRSPVLRRLAAAAGFAVENRSGSVLNRTHRLVRRSAPAGTDS